MLENPHQNQPSYGLITTGGEFIFIKNTPHIEAIRKS